MNLILPKNAPTEFFIAKAILEEYANHEFFDYMIEKNSYFSHTKLSVKEVASVIEKFSESPIEIPVIMYRPWYRSSAIGAWTGKAIKQNSRKNLEATERACHWAHEALGHGAGFSHKGQYESRYDNTHSVPYRVGYNFNDFLIMKGVKK